MTDPLKLLYIVVVDDGEKKRSSSFRYTRSVLQSTLQLMGCKARHAFEISLRVFDTVKNECSVAELSCLGVATPVSDVLEKLSDSASDAEVTHHLAKDRAERINSIPFELYKRLTTIVVSRELFLNIVCDALSAYKYVGPNQRADLILACRIREKKESVTVLLCGTSGCGKSTLSALL